jgi:hypothetical protein
VASDGRSKNGVLLEGGHDEDGLEQGENAAHKRLEIDDIRQCYFRTA